MIITSLIYLKSILISYLVHKVYLNGKNVNWRLAKFKMTSSDLFFFGLQPKNVERKLKILTFNKLESEITYFFCSNLLIKYEKVCN